MAHGHFRHDDPGEVAHEHRRTRLQTFSALKHRNYRFLWVANSFSSTANWIQQITLALLVADLTNSSPFWVATVLGVRTLPVLLIGPLAGVLVDRLDRRKLLMFTQIFLVALCFAFAVGVQLDKINEFQALVFSFLLGVDISVNHPVRQSLIANVVPSNDLTNAYALENSVGNILRIAAPAIGIALITPFGLSGNFYIQAAAYLGVLLILIPMRTPYREGIAEGSSVTGQFMEGLRYIKTDTMLLLLIVLIIMPSVVVHAVQYMLVIFAKDILSGNENFVLGLLYVSMGVGSLVATLCIASLGNFQVRGVVNMASVLLMTVLLIFFGLSSNLALSAVLIGFMGAFNMAYHIVNSALVQSRTPDILRGRVTSIYVIDHGVQPIGIPLLGLMAVWLGTGNAIAVAGVLAFAATAFIGLRWRELWRLR